MLGGSELSPLSLLICSLGLVGMGCSAPVLKLLKLSLGHPSIHTPSHPSLLSPFGFITLVNKIHFIMGLKGERKQSFSFWLGFLLILDSFSSFPMLLCGGGGRGVRVLLAFCHAAQHRVIQAKNFGLKSKKHYPGRKEKKANCE